MRMTPLPNGPADPRPSRRSTRLPRRLRPSRTRLGAACALGVAAIVAGCAGGPTVAPSDVVVASSTPASVASATPVPTPEPSPSPTPTPAPTPTPTPKATPTPVSGPQTVTVIECASGAKLGTRTVDAKYLGGLAGSAVRLFTVLSSDPAGNPYLVPAPKDSACREVSGEDNGSTALGPKGFGEEPSLYDSIWFGRPYSLSDWCERSAAFQALVERTRDEWAPEEVSDCLGRTATGTPFSNRRDLEIVTWRDSLGLHAYAFDAGGSSYGRLEEFFCGRTFSKAFCDDALTLLFRPSLVEG